MRIQDFAPEARGADANAAFAPQGGVGAACPCIFERKSAMISACVPFRAHLSYEKQCEAKASRSIKKDRRLTCRKHSRAFALSASLHSSQHAVATRRKKNMLLSRPSQSRLSQYTQANTNKLVVVRAVRPAPVCARPRRTIRRAVC